MPIQLGGEYRLPAVLLEPEPHLPTVEGLQSEMLLSALSGLREALANMPAPIINVDQPDLTAIVQAVTQIKGSATPGEIAQAVKLAIAPSSERDPDPVMAEMVDALKALDFRLKGIGSGGSGGGGGGIGSYLLSTAPTSDTGQAALPVRIISQLGAGTGGGAAATSVTINDPTTTSQKLAVDAAGRVTVVQSGPVAVTGTFFQTTQPVSGTVTVANPTATGLTDAQIRATPVPVSGTVTVANPTATGLTDTQLRAVAVPVSGAFFQATQPVSATALPLPTGAAQDGSDVTTPFAMPAGGVGIRGWLSAIWTKLNGSLAVTGTFFQATQPVSLAVAPTTPVTGTFFQTTQPVSVAATVVTKETRSSASAATAPSITTASATVLLANANRLGATVYNESGATLYLHMGATASLTAYVLQVAIGGYYEVPFNYTGALSGITAAGTAVCRVVEVS